MFDIKRVLEEHSIHYVTSGANVARGNINIKCPFCGQDDPSEHMGINLETGQWGCWRDSQHRGGNLPYLLSRILKCTIDNAKDILGTTNDSTSMSLSRLVKSGFETTSKRTKSNDRLKLPKEFMSFDNGKVCLRFLTYLSDRGFGNHTLDVCSKYHLKYAITGEWKNRVIIPLYYDKKLVNWTGRSILGKTHLRYKTLTSDRESANKIGTDPALRKTTSFLFNYDDLFTTGGTALFVCEGPFDAIKLDYYGRNMGFRATCLFTNSISKEQVVDMTYLSRKYGYIFILGDRNAEFKAMKVGSELSHLRHQVLSLPDYVDDPAELTPEEILYFCTTGKFPNTDGKAIGVSQ